MTLFCATSPQDHKYDALSYTWGSEDDPKHTITLNNQPFDIGTNLFNALISLRSAKCPKLLWVDALCINQNDDAERSAQVALMGAIYHKAQNVAIFLGLPTPNSYPLFDFLERDRRVDDITQENAEEIMEECGMDKNAVVVSFVEFCDRPWWLRVWVMQEYYVASREALWYIGSRRFGGEHLCRDVRGLAMAAVRLGMPFGKDSTDHDPLSAVLGAHTMSLVADKMYRVCDGVLLRRETKAYNTPRLLFSKHMRKATNPADYVYGVRELLEPHFRRVFVPDYSMGVSGLFERLATWLLLMDGWGDMLWYYPFRLGTAGPSWAPDFSKRPDQPVNEPEPPMFLSDKPKTVCCAIVDRILYIDGCYLDVIQHVIPTPKEGVFAVLQRLWQVDRIFCSNQRSGPAVDTTVARSSRALVSWAAPDHPATLPFAPRFREAEDLVSQEFKRYVDAITENCKALNDEMYAKAKASPDSDDIQQWYKRAASDLAAAYGRQIRAVGNLEVFLGLEMECHFSSACFFDFANMGSQLQIVAESPDVEQGLVSMLSQFGPHEVVYEDLIRNIQLNSDPDEDSPASFRCLASLVRKTAEKIHNLNNIVGGSPNPGPRSPISFSEVRDAIVKLRIQVKKIEEGDKMVCGSYGTDSEKEDHLRSLKTAIKTTQGLLDRPESNEGRYKRIMCAGDTEWGRLDEDRAAQFRGRQFFVTKAGLLGVSSPGVGDVRVGDQVALLDGMSFPLVARECGDSRLLVVGCANVRGVKLHDKVEDVELMAGVTCRPGPKQMMAFV